MTEAKIGPHQKALDRQEKYGHAPWYPIAAAFLGDYVRLENIREEELVQMNQRFEAAKHLTTDEEKAAFIRRELANFNQRPDLLAAAIALDQQNNHSR